MEEYFEYFLKQVGNATERAQVPQSYLNLYKDKVPELLLRQWAEHGWSGYGDGLFWTVNPADYSAVVRGWLKDSGVPFSDQYHVIARGAFGDLYLWQERAGNIMTVATCFARFNECRAADSKDESDNIIKFLFMTMDRETNDFDNLFDKALEKLGPLKADEMYGFVPAIALGGPAELKHLQKVKIIEHLSFLSQLSPLTDWGFPDFETIMKLTE